MSISRIGTDTALMAQASSRSQSAGGTGGTGDLARTTASESRATSASSIIYDEKDTNQDGVVLILEMVAFDLRHPGQRTSSLIDVRA